MNAIWLVVLSAGLFTLAYRYYAAFIAAKILAFNPNRPTPAYRLNDGRDYHPTNKWVLFGHHFAAIAGPGPLIGPVLAAQFGYLPGLLWIVLGCILAGVVHDLVTLFASVRHEGRNLAAIAKDYVTPLTGACTAIAILFIIITALAGLGIVVVNALTESAWGAFAIAVSIPAAIFMGLYYNVFRKGKVTEATVIGVALLCFGVIYGAHVQNAPWGHWFNYTDKQLAVMLPLYGFVASVLPVWLLLCPRDYLSSFMKIGVVLLLAMGIIILHPTLHMPALTKFIHGGGPIVPGPVWPFVCITIACGACSGFHALIASGTTPKMISNERDILPIGAGTMLLEGFVAVMALIAATVLVPHDYFAINSNKDLFQKLLLSPDLKPVLRSAESQLAELTRLVGEKSLEGRTGGAVSLAVGMAYIFSSIGNLKHLMGYWYHFAIMFEALFILTTIDTGTRVARYALQEVLTTAIGEKRLKRWDVPMVLLVGALVGSAMPSALQHWSGYSAIYSQFAELGTPGLLLQAGLGAFTGALILWILNRIMRLAPGIMLASAFVCFAWGWMVYRGNIRTIWPMFGVANQLLATLVLAVGTTFILSRTRKKAYALVTALPMLFMLATTTTAGVWNIFRNYLSPAFLAKNPVDGVINASLTAIMLILVGIIAIDSVLKWRKLLREAKEPVILDVPVEEAVPA